MSEKSNSVTVSTSADYLIGYERILDYFKQAQKECPKGVGLKGVAELRYECPRNGNIVKFQVMY